MIWISEQQQRSEHVEYMTDQVYRLYLSYPHYPVSDIRIIVCVIDFVWDLQNFNFVSRTESHYTVNLTNTPPTKRFYSIRIHENNRIEFPLRTSTFLLFRSYSEKSWAVKNMERILWFWSKVMCLLECAWAWWKEGQNKTSNGMVSTGANEGHLIMCMRCRWSVRETRWIMFDFCSAVFRKLVADEGFSTASVWCGSFSFALRYSGVLSVQFGLE